MAEINVKDASGATVPLEKPLVPGRAAAAASRPVVLSTEDKTALDAILAKIIAGPSTEAKQDTMIAALATLIGAVDGLEGFTDGIEALLAAAIPAGENVIGKVAGLSAVATATFNRPADTTAYVSGDLVANNTAAGSVTPLAVAAARVNAGTGVLRRARLSTSKTGLAGTEIFRVHLFGISPTVANGDNGAFSVNGRASGHIGHIDITMASVFNDGAKGAAACDLIFAAAGGSANLFALIEARGAYTPVSGETFTLDLEVLRD